MPAPHFRNCTLLYKMTPRLSFQMPEGTIGDMEKLRIGKAVRCGCSLNDNGELEKIVK